MAKAPKENYVVKIGPMLRKVLDKQRENIRKVTYGIDESSDWVAGEILADKLTKHELV